MKKSIITFFFIFLCTTIFTGCHFFDKEYYVAIKLIHDDNTIFYPPENGVSAHFETSVGTVINGKYFLIPVNDSDIEIEYLKSSDDSVLEVTEIDTSNKTFKALVKSTGNATIKVQTLKYRSSSTNTIYVK